MTARERDLGEEIEELRAQLIEQEHRALPVLTNFFARRKAWPEGDRRRDASLKALLLWFFFSPGSAAIAGGTIGLLTLGFLGWHGRIMQQQYAEMTRQNEIAREQTRAIITQNRKMEDSLAEARKEANASEVRFELQRRNELIEYLYPAGVATTTEADPAGLRSPRRLRESIFEFIDLEKRRIVRLQESSRETGELIRFPGEMPDLADVQLQGLAVRHANLGKINFAGADFRGLRSGSVDFDGSHFRGADLREAQFVSAFLKGANFAKADLRSAVLDGANLTDANFVGADLRGARLSGGTLFRGSNLSRADIRGISGVDCFNLKTAVYWSNAYRDSGLACGGELPAPPSGRR